MTQGRDVVPRQPNLPVRLEVEKRWRTVRRAGGWHVPAQITVVPGPGTVVLNMLEARPPADGVIHVEVEGHRGSGLVLVIIPDGWGVELIDMRPSPRGDVTVDERAVAAPGLPTVVVSGVQRRVSVKVRGRRWWDAWVNTKDAN